MSDTLRAVVCVARLEPGNHISRKKIANVSEKVHEVPAADCYEVRPDWGVYHPIKTLPALRRALDAAGAFPPLTERDLTYFFGFADTTN